MNFKKLSKGVSVSLLAFTMTASVACGGGNGGGGTTTQKYDPETRPLTMSISTPDGVFNPFFSTSAYDSSIISMTQISMLSADEKGQIVYGDDEPTVVKDMKSTYNEANDTTTYEFILKNGIKFSDGQPLTIKDVLFNLYVYLDPAYTGSSTIYSTDIVGLADYRTQTRGTSDKYLSTFEQTFVDDAKKRIDDLVEFMQAFGQYSPPAGTQKPTDRWTPEQKTAFKKDYAYIAKEFRNELYTDWNTSLSSMETYEKWEFTAPWQIFLLNDGGYTTLLKTDEEGKYIKDSDGNFKLDPVAAAEVEEELTDYLTNHHVNTGDKQALADATKEWAVNTVYLGYFMKAIDMNDGKFDYNEAAFSDSAIDATIQSTGANKFAEVARYWQTADTALTQFAADEKSKYFANVERIVPSISGIDGTTTRTTDFSGKNLEEPHEVLKITINHVDPKAIWNFAFTVAPMHYYSGTYTNKKGQTINYVTDFDQTQGKFGLEFGDSNFMNTVINASNKIGLPLGAGPYMASKHNGGVAQSGSDFMNLNRIYYERNPYFYTLGKGIKNATIKYLQYSVVETDQIINSLSTKAIDVGDPNATQQNIANLNEKGIAHEETYTSGYGYVGVNPRFVPSLNVRRAIMKAMDTSSITRDYYQGGLAELIYRPMSTTSWAYPKGCTIYTSKYVNTGVSYEYDPIGDDIEQLVKDAGYVKGSDGVYVKDIPGFGKDRLDYTFTIAGSSTDHPAYNVFLNAMRILNKHGFAVKVVTSQTALSDLSAGKLEVWAAAWSSTIDPDMYQVYHIDSQATSVNNWGYKQIKANRDLYADEYALVVKLSELIDAGRAVEAQSEREPIYEAALDYVMELAVEMPTYQRKDMTAFNSEVINTKTLTPTEKRSPYNGLFARIWEVNYN